MHDGKNHFIFLCIQQNYKLECSPPSTVCPALHRLGLYHYLMINDLIHAHLGQFKLATSQRAIWSPERYEFCRWAVAPVAVRH